MLREMAKEGTQIEASGSLALLIILPGSSWKKREDKLLRLGEVLSDYNVKYNEIRMENSYRYT